MGVLFLLLFILLPTGEQLGMVRVITAPLVTAMVTAALLAPRAPVQRNCLQPLLGGGSEPPEIGLHRVGMDAAVATTNLPQSSARAGCHCHFSQGLVKVGVDRAGMDWVGVGRVGMDATVATRNVSQSNIS